MENHPQLNRSLRLWHIVLIGLGYMAPMAVFDTFGIVAEVTDGHVPAAYVLTLVAILFTASSYGKMVQVYPTAGSAYTYTSRTINSHVGFLVGWSALLDYLFLPMINALLTKIYLSAAFPEVPGWIWIVGFVLFITVVNIWNIKIGASINGLLVLFQFATVVIFVFLAVKGLHQGDGTGKLLSLQPFFTETMDASTLLTGASILCFSFLGFDAVTTLTEETIDPKRNIPRGIFLVALIGGALFIVASYFTQSLFPDVSKLQNPEGASPEIALYIGGLLFQSVFLAAALTSTIASGIVSHVSASRLLYAMGRDNVLPARFFAYVHPKFQTPLYNVFLIGLLSLTALWLDLLTATSFINFGALVAFTFVHLSVIAHYVVKQKERSLKAVFQYIVSPLIGMSFILFLWYNLEPTSLYLGFAWSLIGFIYLLVFTRCFTRKPPQIDLNVE
ncbi:APC family permease [Brevibacillus fluminis]|uniref:APC family permease n=1 Tax=Brevibacillus fluminis TaxID=511487 RepID=A0A3M8DXK8_9BACL|nr:APC family permease [Brevibacillus fluminis]RNB92275.1 APC family permease [Brevibacillus fluminis]